MFVCGLLFLKATHTHSFNNHSAFSTIAISRIGETNLPCLAARPGATFQHGPATSRRHSQNSVLDLLNPSLPCISTDDKSSPRRLFAINGGNVRFNSDAAVGTFQQKQISIANLPSKSVTQHKISRCGPENITRRQHTHTHIHPYNIGKETTHCCGGHHQQPTQSTAPATASSKRPSPKWPGHDIMNGTRIPPSYKLRLRPRNRLVVPTPLG